MSKAGRCILVASLLGLTACPSTVPTHQNAMPADQAPPAPTPVGVPTHQNTVPEPPPTHQNTAPPAPTQQN